MNDVLPKADPQEVIDWLKTHPHVVLFNKSCKTPQASLDSNSDILQFEEWKQLLGIMCVKLGEPYDPSTDDDADEIYNRVITKRASNATDYIPFTNLLPDNPNFNHLKIVADEFISRRMGCIIGSILLREYLGQQGVNRFELTMGFSLSDGRVASRHFWLTDQVSILDIGSIVKRTLRPESRRYVTVLSESLPERYKRIDNGTDDRRKECAKMERLFSIYTSAQSKTRSKKMTQFWKMAPTWINDLHRRYNGC